MISERKSDINYQPGQTPDTAHIDVGEHCSLVANPGRYVSIYGVNGSPTLPDQDDLLSVTLHHADDFKAFLANLVQAGEEAYGAELVAEALTDAGIETGDAVRATIREVKGTILRRLATEDPLRAFEKVRSFADAQTPAPETVTTVNVHNTFYGETPEWAR